MNPEDLGDTFFQGTKYIRGALPRRSLDFTTKPDDFKVYDGVDRIALPTDFDFLLNDLKHVLVERRSRRRYAMEPMTLQELSTLLKFTAGLASDEFDEAGFNFRNVPSAGGLYPYETYVVANNVQGLNQGLYHYSVPDHALDILKKGDFRAQIRRICLDQDMTSNCAAALAWTMVASRSKWKYEQRAYRYIFIDLGHLAQNFYLVAEGLQLAACVIGALYDGEGNKFLDIDGQDEALCYVGVVGRRP